MGGGECLGKLKSDWLESRRDLGGVVEDCVDLRGGLVSDEIDCFLVLGGGVVFAPRDLKFDLLSGTLVGGFVFFLGGLTSVGDFDFFFLGGLRSSDWV